MKKSEAKTRSSPMFSVIKEHSMWVLSLQKTVHITIFLTQLHPARHKTHKAHYSPWTSLLFLPTLFKYHLSVSGWQLRLVQTYRSSQLVETESSPGHSSLPSCQVWFPKDEFLSFFNYLLLSLAEQKSWPHVISSVIAFLVLSTPMPTSSLNEEHFRATHFSLASV